jgi:hypothetical protein
MALLLSIPAFLALLMLAAHFLRASSTPGVVVSLVVAALLFVPRNWAVRIVQVGLMIGALEWLRTMFVFINQRQADGRPWTRLAIIMIAVECFTVVAAVLLQWRLKAKAVVAA